MIVVTITGNLGADAELKMTTGGKGVCNFRIAAKDHKGETSWFRCALWGTRGEKVAKYLTKGATATVVGSLRFSAYQGKPQYEVDVSEVALGGGGERRERNDAPAYDNGPGNDELPF